MQKVASSTPVPQGIIQPMQTPSTYDSQALARRLNSFDESEQREAQAELRALLAADVRRIKRVRKVLYVMGATYVLFCIHALIAGHSASSGYPLPSLLAFYGIAYLISLPARQAARRIAALDIPQAVGPLIEEQITDGFFRSRHARAALIRLLPRLRPADASWITPQQRKFLGIMLCRDEIFPWYGQFWGKDLKIAILRAMEQVGDQKAFSQVDKMAVSASDLQVRLAARECLPFLQQRIQQTTIEQTLLRASAQSHSPDVLLRPASSVTSPLIPETELLRAAHTADTTSTP